MPTRVNLPDGTIGEFPDSMKDADIEAVLQKQFGGSSAMRPAGLPAGVDLPGFPNAPQVNVKHDDLGFHDVPADGSQSHGSQFAAAMHNAGNHAGRAFVQPVLHPLNTLTDIVKSASDPVGSAFTTAQGIHDRFANEGFQSAAPKLLGDLVGNAALGEVAGAGLKVAAPVVSSAASGIRDAAIGNTDAATLRGLQVGPKSKNALSIIQSADGAKPFLQGADSLEDLQGRVKSAKPEIWKNYQDAVDAIGDRQVNGPDGPTTVRELEDQRKQLSALNRGIKSGSPEALQLAQQKGMTAAELLAQERSVTSALDPELASTGIDPKQIRKSFGDVAQIGKQISGKSTLLEQPKASGFGKIGNISIKEPFKAPGEVLSGIRDIAAGRPMISAKPTDLGIREGFANAGPKPDFGSLNTTGVAAPPRNLLGSGPIQVAPSMQGNAPQGGGFTVHPGTDATRLGRLLPDKTGGSIVMPPPEEIGGTPEGYVPPPVFAGTDASRLGRLLQDAVPARDIPLSSYHDIFPDQIPAGRLLDLNREVRTPVGEIITPKKRKP